MVPINFFSDDGFIAVARPIHIKRGENMIERPGAVTLKGAPQTLLGPELKPGERAPEFALVDGEMKTRTLSEFKGKTKLISVVMSLDTGICSAQTKKFDEELSKLGNNVEAITVSMDLPFTQEKFCTENKVKHTVLSDHREAKFGTSYGTLIKDLRMLCRAIFVVNREGIVTYSEYVKEIGSDPDFDKAIEALKAAIAA